MAGASSELFELVDRGDCKSLKQVLEKGADAKARNRWGVSLLARAAGRGDLEAVELLIAHGADVHKTSDAGNSPLMVAAARGHVTVIEHLLDAGADPDHANNWGMKARDWAQWAQAEAEIKALLSREQPSD